jgi:hypothetical protein
MCGPRSRPISRYTNIPTTGRRWWETLKEYQAGVPTLGTAKVRPATCETGTCLSPVTGAGTGASERHPAICEPGLGRCDTEIP